MSTFEQEKSFEEYREEFIKEKAEAHKEFFIKNPKSCPELFTLPSEELPAMLDKFCRLVANFHLGISVAYKDGNIPTESVSFGFNDGIDDDFINTYYVNEQKRFHRSVALATRPDGSFYYLIYTDWLFDLCKNNRVEYISGVLYNNIEDELLFAGHEEGKHRVDKYWGNPISIGASKESIYGYMSQPQEFSALVERLKFAKRNFPQYVKQIKTLLAEIKIYKAITGVGRFLGLGKDQIKNRSLSK